MEEAETSAPHAPRPHAAATTTEDQDAENHCKSSFDFIAGGLSLRARQRRGRRRDGERVRRKREETEARGERNADTKRETFRQQLPRYEGHVCDW